MGNGENLYSDREALLPDSISKAAFAGAANPDKPRGQYWKPADATPDAATIDNFRDMVFGEHKP